MAAAERERELALRDAHADERKHRVQELTLGPYVRYPLLATRYY